MAQTTATQIKQQRTLYGMLALRTWRLRDAKDLKAGDIVGLDGMAQEVVKVTVDVEMATVTTTLGDWFLYTVSPVLVSIEN